MPEKKDIEREKLSKGIHQWNSNRLDLFEISPPDKNLQFHGVMRFYLEDNLGENIATKCLRVSSVWTTVQLIDLLSEKINPNLRMCSGTPWLWEVQAGKVRRLEPDERPLVVQLNWNKDHREGRFVLRRDSREETIPDKGGIIQNFKRSLSKKDKKKLINRPTEKNGSAHEKKELERNIGPACLPIKIEIREDAEDVFLSAVMNNTNSSTVHFKLSPAFVLYAATRSCLCATPSSISKKQVSKVTELTDKMVDRLRRVIQKQPHSAGSLCFWMSNCCELLYFLKCDSELRPITAQSQTGVSHLLHHSYRVLVQCLQKDLAKHLPTFLLDPETFGTLPKGLELVLNTLMTSMSLLRRCKVHPALSIQLFSQLFHFISAWLFNRMLAPCTDPPDLRSHHWGATLRHRLTPIEAWAERQGLELAAESHLSLIIQATTLLTFDQTVEVTEAQSCCYRLSPLQIRTLLQGHSSRRLPHSIPPMPTNWIDSLVSAARTCSDQTQEAPLMESLTLTLPLLLPEHGHSSQTLRGIPAGLSEFMEPVCARGVCSVSPCAASAGDWTVHFDDMIPCTEPIYLAQVEPEKENVTLNKPLNSGMGLSIVSAKGSGQSHLGIYIKSIVKGGPAEMNGHLSCGDQLLSVDGHSLIGVSQERAAEVLMQTGPVVTLEVAKYAAGVHGLDKLLQEPGLGMGTENFNPADVGPKGGPMVHSRSMAELGCSRRWQKEVKLQRNRQMYRSNPNMLHLVLEEDEERGAHKELTLKGAKIIANSSINLCSRSHSSSPNSQREYLTLPIATHMDISGSGRQPSFKQATEGTVEPHSYIRSTFMRQAISHDNLLCVDTERPLVDKRPEMQLLQRTPLQKQHLSSFPMRQSSSAHNILSDRHKLNPNPIVWHAPLRINPAPVSSIQPIRIDVPLTRSANKKPLLTTFQTPAQHVVKANQTRSVVEDLPARSAKQTSTYDCPVIKKIQPKSSLGNQVNGGTAGLTKHVSFQMDLKTKSEREEGERGGEERKRDVWGRQEMEGRAEQRRLQKVKRTEQEAQRLQAKPERSREENERLQRLNLEFQFEKRLKEMEEGAGEDEELNIMRSIQELQPRDQAFRRENVGS